MNAAAQKLKLGFEKYCECENGNTSSNSCTGNATFELSYGTTVTMLREQMDNVDTNNAFA